MTHWVQIADPVNDWTELWRWLLEDHAETGRMHQIEYTPEGTFVLIDDDDQADIWENRFGALPSN